MSIRVNKNINSSKKATANNDYLSNLSSHEAHIHTITSAMFYILIY